jgi:DNA-binding transcriptional LysR family regulator
LGEHDAALAEAAEYAGGETGRLRIGSASGTFASEQLPGIMSALRRKHPKAELTVTPGTSKTLVEKVVHGDVDVAFVSLPVENASVVVEPLFTEKIVVIVPPGHELAKRRSVSAAALGGERLILGEQGGNTRRMIDAFFDSANVGANVSMELSRQEAVNRMVANGLGIGMAGARSVAGEVGRGTLVPIALEGADIRRELGLVRIRGGYFSPIAREFEALCKESFRDHGKKARRR